MFCAKCGNEIDDNAEFCQFCGNKIGLEDKTASSESALGQNSMSNQDPNNPNRVFTNSKYTKLGGFFAFTIYAAFAIAAICAVVFGVTGISTYYGTSMLNSFMEPITKPFEYIDNYENILNKLDSNYTDEMYEQYTSQSITSALGDFTDLMNYASLMLILFAIAQAFLGWTFGNNARKRKPSFMRAYYIVSALWIVFYIMCFAFALFYNSTFDSYIRDYKESFTPGTNPGIELIIWVLILIIIKVIEVAVYTVYISKSVRVRTYMGTDAYLRTNPFTKNAKAPEPDGDPITVNFDERHGLVTTNQVYVYNGAPVSYTICPYCNKKVPTNTQFCGYCGKQIKY